MPIKKPNFTEGQNVKYLSTGQIGTINQIISGTRSYSYRVTIDGKVRTIAERFLEEAPIFEDEILEDFIDGKSASHLEYQLFQTWFRLSRPLESNLYSYLSSKTLFNPHQFKPLIRFLAANSDRRLYIADEVGVGKTIESGIIVTELLARGLLEPKTPILIVCPNSLGPKWEMEMKERFRLDFHVHDGQSLKYLLASYLQDGILPQRYQYSIVGLQLLRHENYLPLLKEIDAKFVSPPFGLVIIDEAHHMRNTETYSNELGNILSSLTEMMLMLSATPLNLSSNDLYNQMHILNPNIFPDITTFQTMQNPVIILNRIRRYLAENKVELMDEILSQFEFLKSDPLGKIISSHPIIIDLITKLNDNKYPLDIEDIVKYDDILVTLNPLYYSFTRTRKREALEHQVQREAWEIPIKLSDNELSFHNDLIEAIKKDYLRRGGNPLALGFVTNMYRRMVSSSIPAMRKYLEWSIRENKTVNMGLKQFIEDIEDDSEFNIIELDPYLKNEYIRLLNESKKIENIDSKYNYFRKLIENILENPDTSQIIVFSFFIRTLEYLKRRLETEGYKVGIIHGKIPLKGISRIPGRYDIMESFKKGKFNILLSSEVGGEGLDFQYCHAIINYDLPYNPMRIEQRIGRIDRFGQKADKIIIANIFISDTVDEEIYDRLYRRIRLVEDGIGALEPILGDELSNLQNELITGELSESQKEKLSQRIEAAVASAKIQMETFEKHRRELLGDDYLSKPLNTLLAGNFVSPNDAILLTDLCLNEWQGCSFKEIRNSLGEISLSTQITTDLGSFLRRPGNERGYNELNQLFTGKRRIKVVFDGSIADDYSDHAFLSPTGYWTKFLITKLEKDKKIKTTFGFKTDSKAIGIQSGEYLIFLFEVKLEGVKTEIDLVSLTIDINNNLTIKTPPEFLRKLTKIEATELTAIPAHIDPNYYFDIARNQIEENMNERLLEAKKENEFKVESRITALKRSSDNKIINLQRSLDRHIQNRSLEGKGPEERYYRMTNSRIKNEKDRLQNKINELQRQRKLSLDYSFVALINLVVDE